MTHLNTAIDLEALFDIEIVASEAPATVEWQQIKCRKCGGSGAYMGTYGKMNGKKIGDCFACKGAGFHTPKPAAETTTVDVTAIEDAFKAARENGIKSPKLRLAQYIFSAAPLTGSNPGAIYVKFSQDYLGKIVKGEFLATRSCTEEQKAAIVAAASAPHEAAKAYGMATGSCSCCGRELTNGLSIDLGIGPICRNKYGWA